MLDIIKYITISGQHNEAVSAIAFIDQFGKQSAAKNTRRYHEVFEVDHETGTYLITIPEEMKTLTFNDLYNWVHGTVGELFISHVVMRLKQLLPHLGELVVHEELSHITELLNQGYDASNQESKYVLQHLFYMRALLEYYMTWAELTHDLILVDLKASSTESDTNWYRYTAPRWMTADQLEDIHILLSEAGVYVNLSLTEINLKEHMGHAVEFTADLEKSYVILPDSDVDRLLLNED